MITSTPNKAIKAWNLLLPRLPALTVLAGTGLLAWTAYEINPLLGFAAAGAALVAIGRSKL